MEALFSSFMDSDEKIDELEILLKTLDKRRSKAVVIRASEHCRKNGLYPFMVHELSGAEIRRKGTMAWVLAHAVKKRRWKPEMPLLEKLVMVLGEENEDTMCKRCLLDIFQYTALPEEGLGLLADKAISFIRDPKESLAVRAFSITVLDRMLIRYPELFSEVDDALHAMAKAENASIRSRAKKLLVKMTNDKLS